MRAMSLLPASFPLLLLLSSSAGAQSAPPGEVTSEDLLDSPQSAPAPAPSEPSAQTAIAGGNSADPLAVRERAAEQAFADGDLARALGLYRELAAQNPEPAERSRLRVTAAWLEFQLGNPEAARRELTATLVENPAFQPRAEVYSPEFMTLFLDAQRDAAEERSRSAARLLKQGIDALTSGDSATARLRIAESLALAPGALRAIFALAQVDLQEGKTGAALSGFERPVRPPPALRCSAALGQRSLRRRPSLPGRGNLPPLPSQGARLGQDQDRSRPGQPDTKWNGR